MTKVYRKKGVCIICHKEKMGYPVKDDYMINMIRTLKKATNTYKGNKLVVCDDCLDEYHKRRDKFLKNVMLFGGAGALLGLLLIFVNLSLSSILLALFLEIVFLMLAHLQYVPQVVENAEDSKEE